MTADTHNQISGGIFFSAVIQGRDITVQLPAQVPQALSGLPGGSSVFTGRQADLGVLLSFFTPGASGSPATTIAVGGLAGVGKTELAVQAARAALRNGWFTGGVLFADLFGYDPVRRMDPGQALDGWLRALGVPAQHIPPEVQDRARLYQSVLAAYAAQDRPILVVVDNAATAEQVRPLLPADGACQAIVTSRHTLGMLGARLFDLDVLDIGDATGLLDRALNLARPGDSRVADRPDAAAAIAQLCGRLPLALQIVAALLADNPARPLPTMIADLADAGSRLAEMEYGDTAVRAAFDLSYQHLPEEQARLFRLMPVNPGPDISISAAAALAGLAEPSARRLLEGLCRANLIEGGSVYGRWRMHDLVRLYADQHGRVLAHADGRHQAVTAVLEHYLATARAAVCHLNPANSEPAVGGFSDREQALAWLDSEYLNLIAAVDCAAESDAHQTIARDLPITLGSFLDWRRHLSDWVVLATRSLNAARALSDQQGQLAASNSLGIALRKLRRFAEAITVLKDAAQIARGTGDQHGEGKALSSIGVTLVEVGKFDGGIAALRDATQIFHDIGNQYSEAKALGNLGLALVEVGKFGEAVEALKDVAQIFRDTGDRLSEGMALGNLGIALVEVGKFGEAVEALKKDLKICRELGDQHGEGMALGNLGIVLRKVEQFEEAITAHGHAAQVFRDTGDRHSEGTALANLGFVLAEIGRFEESITAYQCAAQIFHDIDDEQSEAGALENLDAVQSTRKEVDREDPEESHLA